MPDLKEFVFELDAIPVLPDGDGPIAVVDDDSSQLNLIDKTFKISHSKRGLKLFDDGQKFLDELINNTKSNKKLPSYVLLDINMPALSGYQVLQSIKSEPKLQSLPVIMFSVSSSPEDIEKSKSLKADGYFSKPSRLKEYVEFFNKL